MVKLTCDIAEAEQKVNRTADWFSVDLGYFYLVGWMQVYNVLWEKKPKLAEVESKK